MRNIQSTDILIIAKVMFHELIPTLVLTDRKCKLQITSKESAELKNSNIEIEDNNHSFNYIIDFSNKFRSEGYNQITFSYINNSDGSMRWIFPSKIIKPNFLNFYSQNSYKSKLIAFCFKFLFYLGIKKVVESGQFRVFYKSPLAITFNDLIQSNQNYSIFTGTIGPLRKIQIEVSENNNTSYFIKIPFTKDSELAIKSEKKNLIELMSKSFTKIRVPKLLDSTIYLKTLNCKTPTSYQSTKFTNLHLEALQDLYKDNAHQAKFENLHCMQKATKTLNTLLALENTKFDNSLLKNLQYLYEIVKENSYVAVGKAHKDFTPWNMFVDNTNLIVFDWESSENNIPLLFDYFHFHFQSGTLVEKKSSQEIITHILEQSKEYSMQQFCMKYGISIHIQLALYLFISITDQLAIYQKQEKLHVQVGWLIKNWLEATTYCSIYFSKTNIRKECIAQFVNHLSDIPYAWLKYKGESPINLSEKSDIDILIHRTDLANIIHFFDRYKPWGKIKIIQKSNMTTISILFSNRDFLSIDLIYEFKRRNLQYLESVKILSTICKNKYGIKIPQRHYDFEYIYLFYTLNKSVLPDSYINQYSVLTSDEKKGILDYMNTKYSLQLAHFESLLFSNTEEEKRINKIIKETNPENKGICLIKNTFLYFLDIFTELFHSNGFLLTISGVDGAGKSTIIEELRQTFEMKFRRKVKIIRHRPSLLPIISSFKYGKMVAEKRSIDSLPRQGKNNNYVSSFFRFFYYYTDYLIGQIYIKLVYLMRGYIVIYDRYYFDFINDSKRSNIHIPNKLVSFLYKFIQKPKLNVLLYADSETILNRKKELTAADINELTHSYKKLFNKLSQKYSNDIYISIENKSKNKTVDNILFHYCSEAY